MWNDPRLQFKQKLGAGTFPLLCLDQENKRENPDQENLGENRQQLVFSCSENGGESGPPIRKMQLDWITPPAEFCNRPVFAFKDSRCPYLFSPRLGSLASIFRCICHYLCLCPYLFSPQAWQQGHLASICKASYQELPMLNHTALLKITNR